MSSRFPGGRHDMPIPGRKMGRPGRKAGTRSFGGRSMAMLRGPLGDMDDIGFMDEGMMDKRAVELPIHTDFFHAFKDDFDDDEV